MKAEYCESVTKSTSNISEFQYALNYALFIAISWPLSSPSGHDKWRRIRPHKGKRCSPFSIIAFLELS